MILSINPATEIEMRRFDAYTNSEIENRLSTAHTAQKVWAATPILKRCEALLKVSELLRSKKSPLAELISLEMGKPLAEASAEVEKCAWNFEFYAQKAPVFLEDLVVASAATDSRIVYDSLGLVLAVMPWNYPFWQVMRAAAPVLAGGNGFVLKHAANVPQCALALENIFIEAGFAKGLFTTLLVGSPLVPQLIKDSRITAVTFTGSTPVGRTIASLAGHALKKQVLELGGSDPFIVLGDANVQAAAEAAVKARFHNTGQSCISPKRFIVANQIADEFVEIFCTLTKKQKAGNPLDTSTTLGTMAKANLRKELHTQVQKTISEGARLLLGGRFIEGPGAYYEATVLDLVTRQMTAAKEEIFGPVAAIIRAKSTDDAIEIANESDFGLGAALWTTDLARAKLLARRIEAGAVFVNGSVASDPRLPFGGIKQSGYGRELGNLGLHEFMNIKTVWTGPQRLF
jgi:succinate-semialdehyde dehydrogenase / glutarate-semialdehyde dehydrogenase